jgi:hypothetical protein
MVLKSKAGHVGATNTDTTLTTINRSLKMATKIITEAEQVQLSHILNGIASGAMTIKQLAIEQNESERVEELSAAIEALAEKIGIAADLGDRKLGGPGVIGDAEQWMMPPAYFKANSTAE